MFDAEKISSEAGTVQECLFLLDENESEFPAVLHYLIYPEEFVLQNELEIAKFWSEKFDCSTIVDGSDYGLDESPFWCVIYENGKFYLGDDSESEFAEQNGSKQKVKIVKKIDC